MDSGPLYETLLDLMCIFSQCVGILQSDLTVDEVDVQLTLEFVRGGISAVSLYP